MGPSLGWVAGWAVCTTGVLVIGSLAAILTLDSLRDSKLAVTILTVVFIVAMMTLCVLGTEPSAKLSRVLVGIQVSTLLLFAVVAIVKVAAGDAGPDSIDLSLSWLAPWNVPFDALVLGLLTGVFIYWGWESAVNLNEESSNSDSAPGLAGLVSTVILLGTYLLVAIGVDGSYTGDELFGIAIPAVLGVSLLIIGIVLMLVWRATGHDDFFGRRRETVDPEVAAGRRRGIAAVPEEAV